MKYGAGTGSDTGLFKKARQVEELGSRKHAAGTESKTVLQEAKPGIGSDIGHGGKILCAPGGS